MAEGIGGEFLEEAAKYALVQDFTFEDARNWKRFIGSSLGKKVLGLAKLHEQQLSASLVIADLESEKGLQAAKLGQGKVRGYMELLNFLTTMADEEKEAHDGSE